MASALTHLSGQDAMGGSIVARDAGAVAKQQPTAPHDGAEPGRQPTAPHAGEASGRAAPVGSSSIRIRAVPPFEPSFEDDGLYRPSAAVQSLAANPPPQATPMLPFDWPTPGPRPVRPVTARQPRGPTRLGVALGTADPSHPSTRPNGAIERRLTPGRVAAQRFAGVCAEVLSGHRPASHLRAVTAPANLARVTDQLIRRTTRAHLARPPRSAAVPKRVRLRTVQVCEPRDGVAELAAVFEYAGHTWAMAARLEREGEAWLCTLVNVI